MRGISLYHVVVSYGDDDATKQRPKQIAGKTTTCTLNIKLRSMILQYENVFRSYSSFGLLQYTLRMADRCNEYKQRVGQFRGVDFSFRAGWGGVMFIPDTHVAQNISRRTHEYEYDWNRLQYYCVLSCVTFLLSICFLLALTFVFFFLFFSRACFVYPP